MHEGFDHSGLGQGLQMGARFAELDAFALDIADAEPLAHELVDVDAAREHVAAGRGRLDRDVSLARDGVRRLSRDQRDRPARWRISIRPVIAIALEPAARARLHPLNASGKLAVLGGDEDRLDPAVHGQTLAAEPAASRSLDRDDVALGEIAHGLRRERLAVQEVAARRARLPAALAPRGTNASLADEREPTGLQRLQLAHDPVAAMLPPGPAGPESKRVTPYSERVLELERLDRSREGVRHRHVHAAWPIRPWAGTLTAADRLVVGEAVVAEGHVVHRPLPLRRNLDRLAERTHHDVDDARGRLDVAGRHRGRRPRVDETSRRSSDTHRREGATRGGEIRIHDDSHHVEARRAGNGQRTVA